MKYTVRVEVKAIIEQEQFDCTVKDFKSAADPLYWAFIAFYHNLTYDFIREFQDELDWDILSSKQCWSEEFIREFQDKVNWEYISAYQELSSDFIREFKDKVDWYYISSHQVLSKDLISRFPHSIDIKVQESVTKKKTIKQKRLEVKEYAKKYKLEYDKEYLYAFRDHDEYGNGMFNRTISYEKGDYYTDWHCDMREYIDNSFGLGIFPKGNTPVKVKISDWGVCIDNPNTLPKYRGQCRVWGFEMI